MDSTQPNHDLLISEFCTLTGASATDARNALVNSEWDLNSAVTLWYTQQEESEDQGMEGMEDMEHAAEPAPVPTQPSTGGGRTLGGGPAPAASSSSSAQPPATTQRKPQGGLRTLKDIQGESSSHGHAHNDDDDDDDSDYDPDKEKQDLFTGGEKSGLAVQNPGSSANNHVNKILERARKNIPRPSGDESTPPPSNFSSRGVTLGGDDAPSRVINSPRATAAPSAPRLHRVLHLWRDGFSVDEGPLFRYDDPANADTLEMINRGAAPLSLLDVTPGQEVDLEVNPHRDEDWKQLPRKYRPFGGSGQRLGSPTPGPSGFQAPPPSAAVSTSATPTPAAGPAAGSAAASAVNVNDAQPTLTLQIRLGDGTSLRSRFNTTHTVGDVYGFVDASSPASGSRPYALMTTFPSKELADKAAVLGDMAEFKRGGVVVQKWK